MTRTAHVSATLACLLAALPASAQDVVIMRRAIAPPRAVVKALICNPTAGTNYLGSPSKVDATSSAAVAGNAAARAECGRIASKTALTKKYLVCEWNGRTGAGASLVTLRYWDAPITYSMSALPSPEVNFACTVP